MKNKDARKRLLMETIVIRNRDKVKKLIALLAAASMMVSLCCACGSGSSSEDTAGDDAVSVTAEETNVSDETGDISAEGEASADEAEGTSEEYSAAADLGIPEEVMEKIYAVFAYEYVAHGLDATNFADLDITDWDDILTLTFGSYQEAVASGSDLMYYDDYSSAKGLSHDCAENLICRDIYYILVSSSYENEKVFLDTTFQELVMENTTFSEDQVAAGAQISSDAAQYMQSAY